MQRNSKKCNKEESAEKAKLKKAIQQGNMEGARSYCDNAIRKNTEALNMLRLSSRIDAVASRVQTAVTMRTVTGSMSGVVKGMDTAMASMNLEKVAPSLPSSKTLTSRKLTVCPDSRYRK